MASRTRTVPIFLKIVHLALDRTRQLGGTCRTLRLGVCTPWSGHTGGTVMMHKEAWYDSCRAQLISSVDDCSARCSGERMLHCLRQKWLPTRAFTSGMRLGADHTGCLSARLLSRLSSAISATDATWRAASYAEWMCSALRWAPRALQFIVWSSTGFKWGSPPQVLGAAFSCSTLMCIQGRRLPNRASCLHVFATCPFYAVLGISRSHMMAPSLPN